jgi:hypothetical protein
MVDWISDAMPADSCGTQLSSRIRVLAIVFFTVQAALGNR